MKKFIVTFVHVGYATVEATSIEDVYRKAEALGKEDVEWADSFETTDAQEEEKEEN